MSILEAARDNQNEPLQFSETAMIVIEIKPETKESRP